MMVAKYILTSVEGSMMSTLFQNDSLCKRMPDGSIFIDRDPEIFEHVIKFLRSDRTYLPRNVS